MNTDHIKVGKRYKLCGSPFHGDVVTVIGWLGGFVKVFNPKYLGTAWWKTAPHQLVETDEAPSEHQAVAPSPLSQNRT